MVVYQSGLVDEGVEVYTSGERFNSVKQIAMIPYSTVSTFAGSYRDWETDRKSVV